MARFVVSVVAAAVLAAGCAGGHRNSGAPTSRTFSPRTVPATHSTTLDSHRATWKQISFDGVQLAIPAAWPVVDGAHAGHSCSSTFDGQQDRAFLGASYQGVPSCPAMLGDAAPADGVWMQPGGPSAPDRTRTVLRTGQVVHMDTDARAAVVNVWYHHVLVQIGIGSDRAVERAVLDSIAYDRAIPSSVVLGRCPAPDPSPPPMPDPKRVTVPSVLDDGNARISPEPPTARPRVSAARVWTRFFHDLYPRGFPGALQWTVEFGSYSADSPAHLTPDGSTVPWYHNSPTWLIRGTGVRTSYGPCGMTVLAPYDADTGLSKDLVTIG